MDTVQSYQSASGVKFGQESSNQVDGTNTKINPTTKSQDNPNLKLKGSGINMGGEQDTIKGSNLEEVDRSGSLK